MVLMTKIEVEYKENGPYLIKKDGNVEVALCRCGASNNKPFFE